MIIVALLITAAMAILYIFIVLDSYGLPDDWFEKGRFITNTEGWEYRYKGVIYHLGMMVSPQSLFAVLAVLGILFSMMGYCFIKERKKV